ncbi:MAG: FRG domain-containing protein [Deltaproteobacteria bacterium]|nr:FRG domain-containing protein [Deltaproteobacteria bacterium]
MDHTIYQLDQLLERLRREDTDHYVYRGQRKDWRGPLIPSLYRGQLNENPYLGWNPTTRLRERGSLFHELSVSGTMPEDSAYVARLQAVEYLRHLFGFPLSQLLAQQFGINSEGLDVTNDPDIATAFATSPISKETNQTGVIFRFHVLKCEWTSEYLVKTDLYSCPWFLSATDILSIINPCSNWGEATESFFNYKVEYAIRCNVGTSRDRPLSLLKLPHEASTASRIAKQKAGLIFPDMILSTFYKTLRNPPPKGKSEKDGMNAVEDIGKNENVETFYFKHQANESSMLNVNHELLFPKYDPFVTLLDAFLDSEKGVGQFFLNTELGVIQNRDASAFLK